MSLDLARLPLRGSRLIEASAGTGKTYTIAGLYLRLVLGHGGEAGPPEPLLPPAILVVTFTEAATRELRERIRQRLSEAAACFREPQAATPDPVLAELLADYPDPGARAVAARRLALAAEWMDEAAVSTIHAWCYRMLREHAFDSGSLFEQHLETDPSEREAEAVRDYWRSMVYPQPSARAALLTQLLGGSPEALHRQLRGLLGHEPARPAERAALEALLDAHLAALEPLKAPWRDDFAAAAASFRALLPLLNGGKYRNPEKLLEAVGAWARDPAATVPEWSGSYPALEMVSRRGMQARRLKNATLPDELHPAHLAADAHDSLPPAPRAAVLRHAAAWVRWRFEAEQRQRAELGFGDLLTRLLEALEQDPAGRLAATIRRQFPVAMIDEFQDTDPVQYAIFERVYDIAGNADREALLLIGDPKQSIYAFRGADIHSYLRARRATAGRHHTLARNFRSSADMVTAVNRLFSHGEAQPGGAFGFRSDDADPVPFQPVSAEGRTERFVLADGPPAALTFWVQEGESVSQGAYRETLAARGASVMTALLEQGRRGEAGFRGEGGLRPLRPADMAVLVRDRREADAVRTALAARGVRSVYLSDRDSVFRTDEAADLLRWLRACAEPGSDRLLRAALATATLDLDYAALERLNSDELHWEQRVVQFRDYHRLWRSRGVLPMLRRLLHDFDLPRRLLAQPRGERRLTNLLHLSELMQQRAGELDGEQALVRHLAEHLEAAGGTPAEEQVMRLESDEGLVQVVTVHKAKGLEYPLVFLPFACSFRPPTADRAPLRYHDADGAPRVALEPDEAALERADAERLAEDVRLLYVAVTRARHACWLGVAPLRLGNRRQNQLHRSALGHLLAGGEPIPDDGLSAALAPLAAADDAVAIEPAPAVTGERYAGPGEAAATGSARRPRRPARELWWIASYSALRLAQPEAAPETARAEVIGEVAEEADPAGPAPGVAAGLHAFPRGPGPGTFLHGLLEWAAREGFAALAADPARLRETVVRRCARRGWGEWAQVLGDWLQRLIAEPLALPGAGPVTLHGVAAYQPELEFWFETRWTDARRLDRAVRAATLDAAPRPPAAQSVLNGLLKGFVDLVFEHEGRYWVADYKSNWLGPQARDYAPAALRTTVLEKRYDLQYVLYTLALHRLLTSRLPDYDYDRHVGGVVYLFLRGIDAEGQGLYCERPPRALIEQLDADLRAGPDAPEEGP
ncbi:exodeoxyribonuclease V subunit beta [Sediminicurvatus halobius]|uniref:RecBCD enzyme subunit RecB n=1 Tax=Sediminicurvatus halobius TaxID=2182432 RepID=A0A2U2MZX0_9GAMM|nr:exodeoxyribonuclease V subunit beta [Spiribacter halobius]PWG62347.1 exodeoxyribonuclease V subunit beta [Spiribacter halobius]UEX79730.1 exodeoxyribonuclease V subunit beta [Spiribacter halobius]